MYDFHKKLLTRSMKFGALKAIFTCGRKSSFVQTLHVCCPMRLKFSIRDLHIMLLSIYEFHENWRRASLAFVVGVNEITSKRVP
jgi:hypothetical protein